MRNCVGLGIVMEEVYGSTVGPFEIADITSVAGHTGVGGSGIVVGGGCEHVTILGSVSECEEPAILINKDVTAITTKPQNITLLGMQDRKSTRLNSRQ